MKYLIFVFCCCVFACAGSTDGGGPDSPGDNDQDYCPSDMKGALYLLALDGELYRYEPATNAHSSLGRIGCRDLGETRSPGSLVVNGYGRGWVQYLSGQIYEISVHDLSCSRTSYQPQAENVEQSLTLTQDALLSARFESLEVGELDVENWTWAARGTIEAPKNAIKRPLIAVDNDTLYALFSGFTDAEIIRLRLADLGSKGTTVSPPSSPFVQGIAMYAGRMYLFDHNGRVSSIDPSVGDKREETTLPFAPIGVSTTSCNN